jgi:hypothetical protein
MNAQGFTFIYSIEFCSNPIELSMFDTNGLGGFFCDLYIESLAKNRQGVILSPLFFGEGWSTDPVVLLRFIDEEVSSQMLPFKYDGRCEYDIENFKACSQKMRPCNAIGEGTFENLDMCKEACQRQAPCIPRECSDLPEYNSSDPTHCVAMDFTIESSASVIAACILFLLIF